MTVQGRAFPLVPVVSLLFLGIFFFCLRPVENNDVWWHLATGRFITTFHQLPRTDVFSWTCAGSPWINNYWLYQILLYALYAIGGLTSLIVYKGLMAVLIVMPVYLRLKSRKLEAAWILIGVWIAFWGSRLSHTGWGERASLATLLGVSWLFWHLEAVRDRRVSDRTLWVWPLALGLWANLHPGFALGLAIVVAYVLGDFIQSPGKRRFLIGWSLLCAIATLATPYGIRTYPMLVLGMQHSAWIAEWQSPTLKHMLLYWLVLAAFWAGVVRHGQRYQKSPLPLGLLLVAFLLTYGSAGHVLHVPFFVLFAVPWLAQELPSLRRFAPWPEIAAGILALVFTAGSAMRIQGGIDSTRFPLQACRFIEQNGIPGPFFNAYPFGGFWIWQFDRQRPVFIDGRYPTVLGYVELREAILRAQQSPEAWQAFLDQRKVGAALLDYPSGPEGVSIYRYYFPLKQWALVYQDSLAVIYLRRTPDNNGVIRRFERSLTV